MQANELRIDNLVMQDRIINQIETIGRDFCVVKTPQSNQIDALIELLQPIPLTKEWLVKLGFVCVWSNPGQTYEKGIVTLHGEGNVHYCGELDWIHYPALEYVHQLQNLYFALTGEELTITDLAQAE